MATAQLVQLLQMINQLIRLPEDDNQQIAMLRSHKANAFVDRQKALEGGQPAGNRQHEDNGVRRRCQQIAGHGKVAAESCHAVVQQTAEQTSRGQA